MNPCKWCGRLHLEVCPRVKAIEYHENGTVKRVEFHDSRPSRFPRGWDDLGGPSIPAPPSDLPPVPPSFKPRIFCGTPRRGQ